MGGATRAPICGAARRAISCGIRTSVRSGPCGPCCSVAPVGTITVWCVFRNASTSGFVISPRNTVAGFIRLPRVEEFTRCAVIGPAADILLGVDDPPGPLLDVPHQAEVHGVTARTRGPGTREHVAQGVDGRRRADRRGRKGARRQRKERASLE